MKPLKYTVAALAILAAASFGSSAHATTLASGSLVLGIDDSTDAVATSLEFNLGLYNTLSNGETWNLGTTASTTYGSSNTLEFNIAASGGNAGGATLAAKELALTAVSLPSLNGVGGNSYNTSTVSGNLVTEDGNFTGTAVTLPSSTSSNGTAISAVSIPSGNTGAFYSEFNNGTGKQYGFADGQLGDTFPTSDVLALYTIVNGSTSGTQVGTFSLSNVGGNEILTFDTLATPEPSAYALGLCAVAIFFVLRRRSTVA